MESGSVSIWRSTAGGDFVEFTLGKVSRRHGDRLIAIAVTGSTCMALYMVAPVFLQAKVRAIAKTVCSQRHLRHARHEEERADTDLADGVCFRLPSIGTRFFSQVTGDGPCGLCFRTNSDKHLGVYGEKTGAHFTTKAEYWPSRLGLEGFNPGV